MPSLCPYCGQELTSYSGQICPACGSKIPMEIGSAAQQHAELLRFQSVLFAQTPRTWAIPAIVVVNALVFVVMVLSGVSPLNPAAGAVLDWGANFGPYTLNGQWWRLITCMFLHFGIIHIGFNMFVLWQIGHLVERLVGNAGLLILYLATGIAASIASLFWDPEVVSAGASGAVFGVCGALLGFITLRRDTIPREVFVSLRSTLITFVIYTVVLGLMIPQIDMAAHLGGFGYGLLCGMALSQPVAIKSVRTRWQRNLLVLLGSAVLLPAAFLLLPAVPPPQAAAENEIRQLDMNATLEFFSAVELREQGAIDQQTMIEMLERQAIPRWRAAQVVSRESMGEGDAEPTQRQLAIRGYLADRVQGLEALIASLENEDREARLRYANLWREADRRQLELFGPKPE